MSDMKSVEERLGRETLAKRLAVEARRRRRRRQGLLDISRLICWGFPLVCKIGWVYTRGRRNFHAIQVRENPITVRRLPKAFHGFRILHLSDLHLDLDVTFTDTLLKSLEGLRYDLVVMTGDYRNFFDGDGDVAHAQMRRLLAALTAPVYGVLGNHDRSEEVGIYEAMGLRILLNEHVLIRRGDSALILAGVDDPNICETDDLPKALEGTDADASPAVLLSHSPSIHAKAAAMGVDVVFAGHTHGGQVRMPGGLLLRTSERSKPRFWIGRWQEGETQGYTSTGSGGCGVPVRFYSLPEVVIHTLEPRN